jgi:hypothetical protein
MTDLLKDVMTERAAAVPPAALDLEAIVRTGNRRIRRRRVAGAAVAVTALAGGVLYGIPTQDSSLPPAGPPSFTERRVTYGAGDRIHYGDTVISLDGHRMASFVQTDSGFVFVEQSGDVYLADGLEVTKIGTGNRYQRLAADDTGSWVGWVDYQRVPEFVVYDAGTRRELLRTSEGNTSGMTANDNRARLVAIDDGVVYFRAAAGIYSWKLDPGEVRLVKPGAGASWLDDIAGGRFAFQQRDLVVSTNLNATTPVLDGSWAQLSPSGTRVATEQGDSKGEANLLYDAETGRFLGRTRSDEGHRIVLLYQWIDDESFVAVGSMKSDDSPVDLLTCTVTSLSCKVTVRNVAPGFGAAIQLPFGITHLD